MTDKEFFRQVLKMEGDEILNSIDKMEEILIKL